MEIDRRNLSLILGFMFPIVTYSVIFGSISLAPWFSWPHNSLSDLGVYSGTAAIFNYGLILSGLIYAAFAFIQMKMGENLLGQIGGFVLLLSGIFLSLVGVFPENVPVIHTVVAWLYFALFPIGAILYSEGLNKTKDVGLVRYLAYLALIVFIFVVLFPWKSFDVTRLAIPEIIASISYIIWHLFYVYHRFISNKI